MKNNNDNFFLFLACSITLHLLVIYFFLFGFPSFYKRLPEEKIITFEILPISNISNVPVQKKQQEKIMQNEDARKVQKTKQEPVETKKAEEKKIEEKKVVEEEKPKEKETDKPKEAINIKEKEKPKEKKKEPDKKITPEKSKSKDKTPPKEKKKKLIDNSELDSLLKNLEQSSEGNNSKSNKHAQKQGDAKQESKGQYNEGLPLSISERALIKKQIEDAWRPPIGSENIDQAKVVLYILLDKDGTVLQVKIINIIANGASTLISQALADSALRAVKQASPLKNLPVERYDAWKEFQFLFDPFEISN